MGTLLPGILVLVLNAFSVQGEDTCSHHWPFVYEFDQLCYMVHEQRWEPLINKLLGYIAKSPQMNTNTYAENLNWIFSKVLRNPHYKPKPCTIVHGGSSNYVSVFGKRQQADSSEIDDGQDILPPIDEHSISNSHEHRGSHEHKGSHEHSDHHEHHVTDAPYDNYWWLHLDCTPKLLSFFRETIPVSVLSQYQHKLLGGLLSGLNSNNGSVITTTTTALSTSKATIPPTTSAATTSPNTTTQSTVKLTTPSATKTTTEAMTKPITQNTVTPITEVLTTQPVFHTTIRTTTQSTMKPTTRVPVAQLTTRTTVMPTTTSTTKTTAYTGMITPPVPMLERPSTTSTPSTPTICAACTGYECFGAGRTVVCSPGQYCLTNVVDRSSGERTIEKRCATEDECYRKWWLGTSDRNVCFTVDGGMSFLDLDCSFCCNTGSCNSGANIIPSDLVQFSSHSVN